MSLLTLDLSSNVGWSAGPAGGLFSSGAYRIPPTQDLGAYADAFDLWLRKMLADHRVTLCVFEAPILPKHCSFDVVRKLTGLAWHTEWVCKQLEIECMEANNMRIKSFMGSGRMTKDDMMEAVKRYGYDPKSFDEADAIAVRLYTISQRFPEMAASFNLDLGSLSASM